MTKAIEEYVNDPDIIHEPEAMREIHAIRLKIHDEIKGMTLEEHKRAKAFFTENTVETGS